MTNKPIHSLLASCIVTLSLAACSSAPKQIDSLETARAAYSQNSGNEALSTHAPAEMLAAKDALDKADRLWKADESVPSIEHYANLASQQLEVAQMIADQKLAEEQLAAKKAEQKEVQLNLHLRRTERAHNLAIAFDKQVSDMQGRTTHRGIMATVGNELFVENTAELTPESKYKMDRIAVFLIDNPQRRAILEGHTDNGGNDDFNLDLSRDRAYAVRTALMNRGIKGSRIKALGFGGSVPLNSNSTAAERQENRRVDLIFPDTPMHLSALK